MTYGNSRHTGNHTGRLGRGLLTLLAALSAGVATFAAQDVVAAVACDPGQQSVAFNFSTDPQAQLDPFIPFNTPGGMGKIKQTILVESASSGNGLEKLSTEFDIDRTTGTFGAITGTSGDTFRDTEVTLFDYDKGFMNGNICLRVANPTDPNIYASDPALLQFDIFRNNNGDLIGAYTGAPALRKGSNGEFYLSSAPNRDSARNYTVYNAIGEQVMLAEITNFLDPENPGIQIPAKLAQNLISEAIGILQRADSDRVLFNNPQDAVVLQNYIGITGPRPFVNVNPALKAYDETGKDIVIHTFEQINLSGREGKTIYQVRPDGSELAIPVVNVRAGADITEGSCSGGKANLQATQTYTNKGVQRNMVLTQNGVEVARGEMINASVNCDQPYTLTANTTSRSFTLDNKVYNGTIGSKPKIVSIDWTKDGIPDVYDDNNNGIFGEPPFDIDCNFPVDYVFEFFVEPPGQYTMFGVNMPQGMNILPNERKIVYNAPCSDAGQTFGPEFYVSGPNGTSDPIQIQLRVR